MIEKCRMKKLTDEVTEIDIKVPSDQLGVGRNKTKSKREGIVPEFDKETQLQRQKKKRNKFYAKC